LIQGTASGSETAASFDNSVRVVEDDTKAELCWLPATQISLNAALLLVSAARLIQTARRVNGCADRFCRQDREK
jgi:hypothetical protein